jgi:hypothetical protein
MRTGDLGTREFFNNANIAAANMAAAVAAAMRVSR